MLQSGYWFNFYLTKPWNHYADQTVITGAIADQKATPLIMWGENKSQKWQKQHPNSRNNINSGSFNSLFSSFRTLRGDWSQSEEDDGSEDHNVTMLQGCCFCFSGNGIAGTINYLTIRLGVTKIRFTIVPDWQLQSHSPLSYGY